ncbi:MAG TPA: oxidoreductase, partial [Methanoculleus sp.]|nr:oxidoreductase [Methanoculleus sp.]
MHWSPEQLKLVEKYQDLNEIPETERRYKCHTCHLVV